MLVDCAHPAMRPCRDPVRSLIRSAADRAVRQVFVDGRAIVRDGRALTIDYAAAAAALEEAQARALSQVRQLDWAGRRACPLETRMSLQAGAKDFEPYL